MERDVMVSILAKCLMQLDEKNKYLESKLEEVRAMPALLASLVVAYGEKSKDETFALRVGPEKLESLPEHFTLDITNSDVAFMLEVSISVETPEAHVPVAVRVTEEQVDAMLESLSGTGNGFVH